MGRRTLLLIASILIAAVGTALIALYVRGADSRAREGTAQVRVYFTTQGVASGTSGANLLSGALEAKTVALNSVPRDSVEEGDTDTFRNLVASVGIVSGAPLQLSMFRKPGTSDAGSLDLKAGRVAASFELTDPQRVANLLQPGMFVSVYSVPSEEGSKATVAVDRVKVLQIGTQTANSSSSLGSATARAVNPNADQVPRTILTFDLAEKTELSLLAFKRDGELALGLVADQNPKNGPSD